MDEQNKQNSSEPHVQIFGKSVGDREKKREEREAKQDRQWWGREKRHRLHFHCADSYGNAIWELAIFLVGILLLSNVIGLITWQIWHYIWLFWPALLILIGLKIIFCHSPAISGLIFLIALAIFILIIIYGLIHINSTLLNYIPQKAVDFVNGLNVYK